MEVFRRFFAKTKTGRRVGGPAPSQYAGQIFKYKNPNSDIPSDEEIEDVDERVQLQIHRNLPILLQGDGDVAIVLRRLSTAWDLGGAGMKLVELETLFLFFFSFFDVMSLFFFDLIPPPPVIHF